MDGETIKTVLNQISISRIEQLSIVKEAINAVLSGGQSYAIGSRRLVRADFAELRKMQRELEAQIVADENASGLFDDTYVAVWDTDPR